MLDSTGFSSWQHGPWPTEQKTCALICIPVPAISYTFCTSSLSSTKDLLRCQNVVRNTFSCWHWCCILSWALSNMPSATCRSTPLLRTSFILSHAFLPVIWAASGRKWQTRSHTTAWSGLEILGIRRRNVQVRKQSIYTLTCMRKHIHIYSYLCLSLHRNNLILKTRVMVIIQKIHYHSMN